MREENVRLQRKLQREVERREALCRQLSESESSLEMDDERYKQPKVSHVTLGVCAICIIHNNIVTVVLMMLKLTLLSFGSMPVNDLVFLILFFFH